MRVNRNVAIRLRGDSGDCHKGEKTVTEHTKFIPAS